MRIDETLGLLRQRWGSSSFRLFELELLFWVVVVLLTLALVRYRPLLLEKAELWLRKTSQHKKFWLAAFILGVILVRISLLPWIPVPVPSVADEYSYLLAADTFAHGRLTNPASPMWVHFETFHVNMQPTYQSMYPPAQGTALAIGQVLTGLPWIGVLLSTALMCGAIYWMLLGWLPAPWAWLGGAFACVRFGVFSYWVNSYWGGAVAALGGALVLGAFARFRSAPKIQTGLLLAAGLLLMANSRPLEGLLFSIPLVVSLLLISIKRIRTGSSTWTVTAQTLFPAIALLALGAAWMMYYNWRGTGSATVWPYQVNFQTYHISKPFLFQTPNPVPKYRHLSMRATYVGWELPDLMKVNYDLWSILRKKVTAYYGFYIWPFALLIVPCALALWRNEMRVVLLSVLFVSAGLFAQLWLPQPHYAAPAAGALILALLFTVRHYRSSPSAYAIWGSRAVVTVLAVWMISPVAEALRNPFSISPNLPGAGFASIPLDPLPLEIQRASIESKLNALSGKQLIIVHYPYMYAPWVEWIFNDADLDHAHVVWARDMGYLENKELLNYYSDRQVWYTVREDSAPVVLPYDQFMAPFKMAFETAASEKVSPQVASANQPPSPAIAKPAPVNLTEIAAPRPQ
jgi:hypothetical protein